jgi:ABC-type Mn2+/Zn2+ transport system permease subunit/Mn-dependent DtxR family transcriptional regulator
MRELTAVAMALRRHPRVTGLDANVAAQELLTSSPTRRISGRLHHAGGRFVFLLLFLLPQVLHAARISELTDTSFTERAVRFFTFQDPSLRFALAGSVLLGICCGLMGSFLVVRKLALMSDALSHAVLPGVALGFLWNMQKDPLAIFLGASLAGLLGAGLVQAIRHTTKHKEDAALGFVLASFFAVGACLVTMIQNLPEGNKSGLDKFMFGQAAALGSGDIQLLAIVTGLTLVVLGLFYKEFLVTSFDAGFARSTGIPAQVFHYILMVLLAFAIVSSLQAVGVVLVAAMLVIPAAAAYLLTDRFGWMLVLSAAFGVATGAVGSFFSFVGRNLPTGPLMVLAATVVFLGALTFGPRHGVLAKWWRQRSRAARIGRENMLKAMYHVLETENFRSETVAVRELAEARREPIEDVSREIGRMQKHGLVTFTADHKAVVFTPDGWKRACEIVRNHRLWELYLTHAANYAVDHVHEDAEKIEHILGEDTVRQLEKRLNYAHRDPHGKLIPGHADIYGKGPAARGNRS